MSVYRKGTEWIPWNVSGARAIMFRQTTPLCLVRESWYDFMKEKSLDSLSPTSKDSEKLSVGRPPSLMASFVQVFFNLAMRPANVKSDQFLRLILVPQLDGGFKYFFSLRNLGKMTPIWPAIVCQMAWFNHQLVNLYSYQVTLGIPPQ